MKRIVVDKLIAAFPLYADLRLLALPDGWLGIVNELFCDFRDIQKLSPGHHPFDADIEMVDVDWRLFPSTGYMLYVRPHLHYRRWTPEMALRLVQVVARFNANTDQVCEVCGQASVGTLKYQDARRQERLCEEHMEERRWT